MSKLLDWVKEHPYESGGIVLGALVLYYLFTHSGSAATTASGSAGSSASDYYSAQLQLDQLNAQQGAQQAALQQQTQTATIAASVENNQTAAQLALGENQDTAAVQAAQIQAGVTNNETQAQVDVAQIQGTVQNTQTQAQVQENADNLGALTTLVSGQDAVQESEIQSQVTEQANNDQTAVDLSGQQYGYLTNQSNNATAVSLTSLNDETELDTQAQANALAIANQVIPLAGQQKNSALDATDQTDLFETLLSGGSASVAAAGVAGSSNAVVAGDNQNSAIINGVASTASKALLGLFA